MVASALRTPPVDWFALSPALDLLGALALCLLAAALVPARWRKAVAGRIAGLGFVAAFVDAAFLFARSTEGHGVVADAMLRDRLGALAAVIITGAGLATVWVTYAQRVRDEHVAEYFGLIAAAASGMIFLTQANNLLTLFLALEWFSISLYILCAIDVDIPNSLEAGLKYLITGGFGSAILLFGSALVYGATGRLEFGAIADAVSQRGLGDDVMLLTGLAMILAGLAFKASAAPFHMWTPDVYEGSPTPVTGFMAAATKTAAIVLTLRVLTTAFPQESRVWSIAVAVLAVASLVIGNLAALVQKNLKRMLAYSSVSHAGFLLIGVAANNPLGARAVLYYLIPYSAMSVGAFAVVAARERELQRPVTVQNIAGLGWERPVLGASLWIFMLGFAGLPLTGGLWGKVYVFAAAYDRGWTWLVLIGVIATAVSLYYYLAVIRAIYGRTRGSLSPLPAGGQPPREIALNTAVLFCAAVTVGSFFGVQPLIDLARSAVNGSLPF